MGLFMQCLYALSLHLVAVVLALPSLHPCTFLENVLFTCIFYMSSGESYGEWAKNHVFKNFKKRGMQGMRTTQLDFIVWQCASKTDRKKATQVTSSLRLFTFF